MPAKNPRRPLVFVTATSAARSSALRRLVPVIVSLATGVPALPLVMVTLTWFAPAGVKWMEKAPPLATSR